MERELWRGCRTFLRIFGAGVMMIAMVMAMVMVMVVLVKEEVEAYLRMAMRRQVDDEWCRISLHHYSKIRHSIILEVQESDRLMQEEGVSVKVGGLGEIEMPNLLLSLPSVEMMKEIGMEGIITVVA